MAAVLDEKGTVVPDFDAERCSLTSARSRGGIRWRTPRLTRAVTEDGRFVGLLTPENVGEIFMSRRARARRSASPPLVPPVIGVPPVIADLRPGRGNAT